MPETVILPDVELLVRTYLAGRSDVLALVGGQAAGRIVTELPKHAEFPVLRIMRIGGAPLGSKAMHRDRPVIQLDAWGGSKADARRLVATAQVALDELAGTEQALGIVSGVVLGPARSLPDPSFTPAKPRYTADVELLVRSPRSQ